MLSTVEVSKLTGISQSQLRHGRTDRKGKLLVPPSKNIAGHIVYDYSELKKWLVLNEFHFKINCKWKLT